jgi:hypothetical protein
VPSRSGHGIGLYQAAKRAEMMGYSLALTHNRPGQVCFELTIREDSELHVDAQARCSGDEKSPK